MTTASSTPDPASRRASSRRSLLAAGVLVAACVGAEVAHRLWLYGPAGFHPARLASVRPLGDTDLVRASDWPLVGHELQPGVRGWFKLARFSTNRHGLRDPERELAKPPGVLRVALVGDSYAMGSGVADGETFARELERRLDASAGGARVEVLNLGVGGYGLLNALGVVRHRLPAWDPDLVVLAVSWNDVEPPPRAYLERLQRLDGGQPATGGTEGGQRERAGVVAAAAAFLRPTLLARLTGTREPEPELATEAEAARAARAVSAGPGAAGTGAVRGERAPAGTSGGDHVAAAFEALAAECRAAGLPVLCVFLSTGDGEPGAGAAVRLGAAARAVGFDFLDTRPALAGIDRGELIVRPDDGHPGPRAHRLYAEALERALAEGGWLTR